MEQLELNLHSINGPPTVASGAHLTVSGCDVVTVSSRQDAASGPLAPEWSSEYFGTSTGTIRLENSRMLMPAEVRSDSKFVGVVGLSMHTCGNWFRARVTIVASNRE